MSKLPDSEGIHASTFIAAPPTDVFRVISTAEGWDSWFTSGTSMDSRPGGEIRFRWRNWGPDHFSADEPGQVVAIETDRLFAFHWTPNGFETLVRLSLTPRDRGTVLTVEDVGYPESEEGRRTMTWCACGWGEALTLVKFYLEHGVTYGDVPAPG